MSNIIDNPTIRNKASIRRIILYVGIILFSAIIGTVLLLAAYQLPIDKMVYHMQSSAALLKKEGQYPKVSRWCTSQLDNYTDALMLQHAADDTKASVVNQAMFVYNRVVGDKGVFDSLLSHYIDKEEYTGSGTYSRYWHGYLIVLKPLLALFDYQSIRIFNGIVQTALFILACYLFAQNGLKEYVIPYFLTHLMQMPVVLAKSLQFSSCYYIYTIGVILILLLHKRGKGKYISCIFLCIGIATAYFDYLTYPIATLGVPLLICLLIPDSDKLENQLSTIITNGLYWAMGYGGMWSLKWVIAYLLTGSNEIAIAVGAFLNRSSHVYNGNYIFTPYNIIMIMGRFFLTPISAFVIAYLINRAVCILKDKKIVEAKSIVSISVPFFLVGCLPVLWYLFAANHSVNHSFFSNKACVVFALAFMLCFSKIAVWTKNRLSI